jgi:hypothetical protein
MPTEQLRKTVETMAAHGIPVADIARVVNVQLMTLYKYYRDEIDTGHVKANSMVAQSLYQKALGNGNGAVAACIFWLKCRAGWNEYAAAVPPVGKKEQAQINAIEGAKGTEWGSLVQH